MGVSSRFGYTAADCDGTFVLLEQETLDDETYEDWPVNVPPFTLVIFTLNQNRMTKHIGIVSVNYVGTALCYRSICAEVASVMGEYRHPEITIPY